VILPYFGEFLIIPMALEFSFNPCSNGCAYCFSNLNKYKNKTTVQAVMNKLATYHKKKDNVSLFLQNGYSICFSNRTDPFSKSNIEFTRKFLEVCTELDIDIAYQTKGSDEIIDIAPMLKPAIWYFTLSQDNEQDRKRIEPNTISIEKRLKIIEKLVALGHKVNVGINPFVPEWVKNKKEFVKRIKNAGVYGITVEGLHFSHEQNKNFTEAQRKNLTKGVIDRALNKQCSDFEFEEYKKLCDIILKDNIELWSFWNYHSSKLWDPYYDRYQCFPIVTNFINYVIEKKQNYDVVTFMEFIENIGCELPEFQYKIDSYIVSVARNLYRTQAIPVYGIMKQLLYIFWKEVKLKTCPANHPYLSIIVKKNKNNELEYVRCENNMPMMMVNKNAFKSLYVYEDGKEVIL